MGEVTDIERACPTINSRERISSFAMSLATSSAVLRRETLAAVRIRAVSVA